MKLRNKKTGEIRELPDGFFCGDNLKKICKEWEDYEEPKKHYEILGMGAVVERVDAEDEIFRNQGQREIGNYFESLEEAEKAVEKLKAFKRLKDKGFRFDGWDENHHNLGIIEFSFPIVGESVWDFEKDLDLLFGDE